MFQQEAGVPAGSGKTDVISPAQRPAQRRYDKQLTRQHIIDDVVETLTSESGCGVVLVGEHGAGKSFVAQRALEQLGGEYLVVQVRGSSISSKLPYGALSVLLNDLDSSHLEHPLMVLRGLIHLLHAKAQGRGIVLFVDNAHDLDDLSCMMVAQLSAGGHVTLLAACVDLPHVGGDIMGLWKDDLLRRVDLEPFDFAETAATLNQEYGGHFSHTAVRALWTASGGNALFLHSLAREQIKLGAITRQDGAWVLGSRPISLTGEVRDVVKARMNRLSAGQRDVFEMLALAGALPLQTLMSIFNPHDMDTLQERGLIQVSHDHTPTVCVANTVTAAIVASVVPPGRSAELRRRLTAVLGGDEELEPGGPTGVAWALDCGERISPVLALAAAQRANNASDSAAALRFLQAVGGFEAVPAGAIEAARAHLSLGNEEAARRILQKLVETADDTLPVAEWVTVNLLLADIDQRGAVPAVASRLQELSQRLEARAEVDSAAAVSARTQLLLAEARFAVHEGRYADVLAMRGELDVADLNTEAGIVAGGLLCEAMTVTGNVLGAIALGKQVLSSAAAVQLPDQSMRELRGRFLLLMLLTSRFREAAEFLALTSETSDSQSRLGGMFEIGQGLIDLHAGRLDEALSGLDAGLWQLRTHDRDSLAPLAVAAAAYAAGLHGDTEEAGLLLAELGGQELPGSWLVGRMTRYFQLGAEAELGQRAAAIRALAAEAEKDVERGSTTVGLLFQSAAARLGDRQMSQKLGSLAEQVTGQFAMLCQRLATGVREAASEALLTVAKDADAAGDAVFARDVARKAVTCANEAGNRIALRVAQRTEHTLDDRFGGPKNGLQALTSSILTARECEVAVRAAAGTSNRKIAEQMQVSVRTVEGHLYQVYAKLHLASRSELKEAIAGPTGNARIG
ncbi:LuxR C-terminal-related transcriptional regulator [Arthrobacter sp. B3I4]|uniref:LuxR C-terminal-related transcriptional regulator n=1 Tax=Arthrobacter sp. B3I4 TaxID=3042267 RepID=UPI0027864EAF|nr:LuxR C-terminal-related transcriptional regulator [Arthrobacter sp. B3I4]MDQ0757138.1 DNA-binding CsgD family transcriptional regulator/tetratricopeptide (TPR) repeat protein [Arthrobacter sp. B3I4]